MAGQFPVLTLHTTGVYKRSSTARNQRLLRQTFFHREAKLTERIRSSMCLGKGWSPSAISGNLLSELFPTLTK